MASKGPKNSGTTPAIIAAPKPRVAKAKAPVAAPFATPAAPAVEPVIEPAAVATTIVPPASVAAPAAKPAPVIESAVEAVTTPAAEVAETAKETIMATTFEAPKTMNDVNDRAKTAMEKGTKMFEDMNDFAKGNVEAMVESSRITAKGLETMGQDAAEYGRKSFEGLTATLKNLAAVKSPADFFKLQSDYMRSSFDSAVAEASKGTEAMIKLAGDAAQPISNRFAVAAEKVKTVA